jgi:hypothetical protein
MNDSRNLLDRSFWGKEAFPPMAFSLHRDSSVVARLPSRRTLIASVDGKVVDVDGTSLWLAEGGEVALSYVLPKTVDLRKLLGQFLRVTLQNEAIAGGGTGQMLTINGVDGRVWLIAHCGTARWISHAVSGTELRAALSQRAEGPLVIGTPELQWLIRAGGSVPVRCGAASFVVEFVARTSSGCAAYLIADESIHSASR